MKMPEMKDFLCGPIQYDAAIDPKAAEAKEHSFPEVAGRANILICPDVSTSALLRDALRFAGERTRGTDRANAIGPGVLGLKKQVADLSRAGTAEEYEQMIALYLVLANPES
jgi:phosphotransacetylase